jgi:hypothetical protein
LNSAFLRIFFLSASVPQRSFLPPHTEKTHTHIFSLTPTPAKRYILARASGRTPVRGKGLSRLIVSPEIYVASLRPETADNGHH